MACGSLVTDSSRCRCVFSQHKRSTSSFTRTEVNITSRSEQHLTPTGRFVVDAGTLPAVYVIKCICTGKRNSSTLLVHTNEQRKGLFEGIMIRFREKHTEEVSNYSSGTVASGSHTKVLCPLAGHTPSFRPPLDGL